MRFGKLLFCLTKWRNIKIYKLNTLYMKKVLIISSVIVGILLCGFLVVQLFSAYIYKQKNSAGIEPGNGVVTEIPDYDSSYDLSTETPQYNDEEGSKIQKNGSILLLVKNIDEAAKSLGDINKKYLGEITNIYDYGKGNDRSLQLIVKVPVKDFEAYYNEIRGMDGEVTYANLGTTDLTERYIDITSRLENLRKVEAQLASILEEAKNVTDILAVQKELNSVRGDIESYEAQKRYFDSQTDYSYLTITFNIDKEGLNIVDEEWKPGGEFRVALNALVSFLKSIVNIGIWILVFSPLVLIPAGVVMYVTNRKRIKKA